MVGVVATTLDYYCFIYSELSMTGQGLGLLYKGELFIFIAPFVSYC